MRIKTSLLAAALLIAAVGTAHAAGTGNFPGAGMFTTVEGWLSSIGYFGGVLIIFALGGLIWLGVEFGHMLSGFFRSFVAIAFMIFAVAIMGLLATGVGVTITPPAIHTGTTSDGR